MTSTNVCTACLTLPPVEAQYTTKGDFSEYAGLKTYVTGPSNAETAIVLIYDIFGIGPQIQQGADMLTLSTGGKRGYQVFLPDFLKGKYADGRWFDGSTEGGQAIGKFFSEGGPAEVGTNLGALQAVVNEIKVKHSHIKTFGMIGYCWGAKIVSLSAGQGTAFSVAAEVHPSMVEAADGKNVSIPICVLASGDEDARKVQAFVENVQGPEHYEVFSDMPHGWMAARGDLENDPGKKEFYRGYQQVLSFFETHRCRLNRAKAKAHVHSTAG